MFDDWRRPSFRPMHQSVFHLSDHEQVIALLDQPAAYCPAFGFDLLIVGDVVNGRPKMALTQSC